MGRVAEGRRRHIPAVYLTRDTDFSVVTGESVACAVYAKFARFLVWAEVTPANPSEWVNTVIITGGAGVLPAGVQELQDKGFGSFLIKRGEMMEAKRRELHDGMSTKQRDKVKRWAIENADGLAWRRLLCEARRFEVRSNSIHAHGSLTFVRSAVEAAMLLRHVFSS